jgi:3-ketoacyl-CoA synthase
LCIPRGGYNKGERGLNLSKDLVTIASDSLQSNITTIGSLALPFSEKIRFGLPVLAQKLLNQKIKGYEPNFRMAFEHVCIHAGGRAVIDAVQHSICLSDENVEPSRMTLHRFGNTSSNSVWYDLGYIDAKNGMQNGDQIWMIGFGFKCNSIVWQCIQTVSSFDGLWAGMSSKKKKNATVSRWHGCIHFACKPTTDRGARPPKKQIKS